VYLTCELEAEIKRLSAMILQARCIYCGEIIGVPLDENESDAMKQAHIELCDKHPLFQARAEIAALRAKLDAVCEAGEGLSQVDYTPLAEWDALESAIAAARAGGGE
jgi:hypothetical protein